MLNLIKTRYLTQSTIGAVWFNMACVIGFIIFIGSIIFQTGRNRMIRYSMIFLRFKIFIF
jgi:hypothetical protein